MEIKDIAWNYMRPSTGWFCIDFISVFPFKEVLNAQADFTKLFRLFRLPRLLKLIDIEKFK